MADENGNPLQGRRVLVVEDEYFLADDMSAALKKLGAEVIGPENTTAEALARLDDAGQVHAAVLDVNLGGGAAFPLADALRERDIAFVFCTGYEVEALPPAYRDVPRWQKPYDAATIALALGPLLESAGSAS